jgi:8-amino-3,8-dideoxy-alpha-D-manno-octulosonate transaminase
MDQKLAIDGGTPARSKPLPPNYPGALMLGEEEAARAAKVIRARSPFRFYGVDQQDTVLALEEMMARELDIPYVLGVSSGTAALMVALKALGIGYGDKVIVPAVTFLATATAVICSNAVPVFADVDESLNLDPNALEAVMDEDVKALIAVPIVGVPCDMDGIMAFARRHKVLVIEDVAQSCGVQFKGRHAGTIGDIGTYSFQQNKILTSGEGGAIATRDLKTFEWAVRYHDQGTVRPIFRTRYGIDTPDETGAFAGQNYRMSEISGAVLVEQWKKLDQIVSGARANNRKIRERLRAEIPSIQFRKSPDPDGDIGSTLGFLLPSAEVTARFTKATAAENIQTWTLYGGKPVFMNPGIFHQRTADGRGFPYNYPFKKPAVYREDDCPRASELLPRSPIMAVSNLLTDSDVEEVVGGIAKVYKGLGIG